MHELEKEVYRLDDPELAKQQELDMVGVGSQLTEEVSQLFDKEFNFKNLIPEEWFKRINNKLLNEEITEELLHDPVRSKGIRKAELMELLLHADKDIFKAFRDKELTMS